ncbi:plasminogen-binding N-terminal domain-containing protein [Campylobacter volucris]|nr:plasminogen-binding N-terminal domain-containing protein [Campylobacter volucris]MBF7042270.1 plasminogen-binding N-terminal domain-containing protein [Campylobacter volucris]MBF7047562.1 plasminogen-binding N-terminal domain-containing protein [Campylobacter volucris]MBF7049777.1 plasminogen-binding N-terminal domain-containing protein [Campylobacter volucris]MBF7059782.1 plasminogen-binding N-terminal domain-containing protein [Campylobacter volucris]MBF7068540.1 plasminogen-binding N-ter
MIKIILMCFCFIVFSYAKSFDLIQTKLEKVEDIYGYVKDDPKILMHSSGIVVHNIENQKTIVARASVIGRENGFVKLQFKVFDMLTQDAMPLPNVLPEVGDKVVLNYLYDRALIIAPDKKVYDYIAQKFSDLYFLHPDLFGAHMIQEYRQTPRRSDFRSFCSKNAVGLLVVALEKKAELVDCQDFEKLQEIEIPQAQSLQIPFYSRITGYKSDIFSLNDESIGNYYIYYEKLINLTRE